MKINIKHNKNMIKSEFKTLHPISLNRKGVLVVDAPPGAGKTESAIDYINSADGRKTKFIYVTPFLSEVDRIIKSCPDKNFKQPNSSKGTKKRDFINLILQGENIVCTHALFDNLDIEILKYFTKKNYILIMDEVADVVQQINVTKDELNILLYSKMDLCHIDPKTFQLVWDYPDCYMPRFEDIKSKAELGSVYVYADTVFFWAFPIEIFNLFSKSFILTYKYSGQIQSAYYKYFDIKVNYVHIEQIKNDKDEIIKFKFEDKIYNEPQQFDIQHYKKLINIYKSNNLNEIGSYGIKNLRTKLSSSWYKNNNTKKSFMILKNNCENYYKKIIKVSSDEFMWTCFKDYKNKIQGHGMAKNFVPSNMRATNDYINKTTLAYLINCYLNPVLKGFFLQKGIIIDENEYALSEMLQWIFRSRIRKHEPINIYIPSQRMRELLINWE